MKPQKLFLALSVLALTFVACTKQSLTEDDEMLQNQSEIIYATGGQSDQLGGVQ